MTVNWEKKRFEEWVDGELLLIDFFEHRKGDIYLVHTEVPKSLAGRGLGSKLVLEVLEYLKANDRKLVPLCPFVFAYIQEHPEWKPLVSARFKRKI